MGVKSIYLLIGLLICTFRSFAQDSADQQVPPPRRDTVAVKRPAPVRRLSPADSIARRRRLDSIRAATAAVLPGKDSVPVVAGKTRLQPYYLVLLRSHPYFNFFGKPRNEVVQSRADAGKEPLFYLLVGIVLYFAFIQLIFRKYLDNLFSFFFRASMRQKQIREHLMHSPVPALLLNIFFIISGGVFATFIFQYYQYHIAGTIWRLMLYGVLALSILNLSKLIMLKLVGWIFSIKEAVNTYIFVVYSINKLIGIFLLPFVILLAFSERSVAQLLITLSFIMIVLLFMYRYIVAYVPVRREIKVSQFHFMIYILAFELMPLLLIYKVLIDFLEKNS